MSSLPLEIHAYIEIQTTEVIIRRELRFAVTVTVNDGTHTSKPARIVPHDTKTSCAIKCDITEGEITETTRLTFPQVTFRLFIGQGQRQTGGCQPVVSKNPVIGISS